MKPHADEQLRYWSDRFVDAGLGDFMRFDEFMELSVPLRERRITSALAIHETERRAERDLPDAGLHGKRLIDPFLHGIRKFRRAWFYDAHHRT
jgi:hypothetical protein